MPKGKGEALESKAVRDCRGLLNRWSLRACVSNTLLSSARHGLRHASRFSAAELAGSVSEWLGAGLQNPLHWFESSRNLENMRRWQNWLCTTLPRWTTRVRVPALRSNAPLAERRGGCLPSSLTHVQIMYGAQLAEC
jgi:hypothetical protein